MRFPVIGDISTKDGDGNQNARLTNTLAEVKKNGTTLATVRPGLNTVASTTGNGNGLVCFGGDLVNVFGATLRKVSPINTATVIGVSQDNTGDYRIFTWDSANGMTDWGEAGDSYGPVQFTTPATAISTDGTKGAGTSKFGIYETACKWEVDSGLVDLGTLGSYSSQSFGISRNGEYIVGQFGATFVQHAFRYSDSTGMVDITGSNYTAIARGVSDDGVVAGVYGSGIYVDLIAFRWTQAGGYLSLGTLPTHIESEAFGISSDGGVIVGVSRSAFSVPHAFRWTSAGGMVDLGTLGGSSSIAFAVSSDGGVVVGLAHNGSGLQAFKWDSIGGMIGLGSSGVISAALGVSPDGEVVVGWMIVSGDYHAFVWTAQDGVVDLGTLGGTNSYAHGVSDSNTINILTDIATLEDQTIDFALIP